ncbi:MAG: hypothetical protein FWG98_06220 [Candidatus Cloacimonetes bacterium]|nr:hypothetical protein [Candidatus Cloacimonadota bacterium]
MFNLFFNIFKNKNENIYDIDAIPKLFTLNHHKETIDYFKGILSYKFKLYNYCEQQLNRLAFVNSIFIAAMAVLINNNVLELNIYTIIVFLPFLVSLGITLINTIPKFMTNGIDRGVSDHRTIYGIDRITNIHDYKEYILKLKPEKIYDELIHQIYRINSTIVQDYKAIKLAVIFDLVGLLFFVILLIKTVLC